MVIAAVCSSPLLGAIRAAADPPVKVVALGDSLTAGYGLPAKDGFVPRLQEALTAKGTAAKVANGGVSGDTASDGLARLDWS
ncbi:MAG TPA: SGNH/GDSL hydrolase family protein, partial [Xanthobacteraceae bacterium]|nr:SGNH/GDSL hydrolase family protein [Xanthobacteraceae bacterium]